MKNKNRFKDGIWHNLLFNSLASGDYHAKVVAKFLKHGADITKKIYGVEFNALHIAAQEGYDKVVENLLEHGADIDEKINGFTALYIAAEHDHDKVVAKLLEHGADITKKINGINALHIAAQEGHAEIVTLLLNKGANVNKKTDKGFTTLYIAAQQGHDKVVKLLLEHDADIDEKINGFTVLHIAAYYGHDKVVTLLLKKGANIEQQDNFGNTPLFYAVQQNQIKIVEILLNNEANVSSDMLSHTQSDDMKDLIQKKLFTTINFIKQNKDIINYLPKRETAKRTDNNPLVTANEKLRTDYANKYNATTVKDGLCLELSLLFVGLNDEYKIEGANIFNKILLELGNESSELRDKYVAFLHDNALDKDNAALSLDPRIKDLIPINKGNLKFFLKQLKSGESCYINISVKHTIAISRQDNKFVIFDSMTGVKETSLDSSVELIFNNYFLKNTTKDLGIIGFLEHKQEYKANQITLLLAARYGFIDIVNKAIQDRVKVNITDEYGYTPLYIAAAHGHNKVVEKLLDNKEANIDEDINGSTALHIAVQEDHNEVVTLLLNKGANVNKKTDKGTNALYIAAERGHDIVVEKLLKHGADINEKINGINALYIAAAHGHDKVVTLLLNKGANVNKKTDNGFTALHIAEQKGHNEVVELLLNKGANKEQQNQIKIIQTLRNNVANLNPNILAQRDAMKDLIRQKTPDPKTNSNSEIAQEECRSEKWTNRIAESGNHHSWLNKG